MIRKIKAILRTKDTKVLIVSFMSLGVLQIVNFVLPLAVLLYMVRVVGFERYGILVFTVSLIAYFSLVTDYSFRIKATRDVAVFNGNKVKLDLIYSKVITIKEIFLFLSWLIIGLIVVLFPLYHQEPFIYFCSALFLLGYALCLEWFFQVGRDGELGFFYVQIGMFPIFNTFVYKKLVKRYWQIQAVS